MDGSPRSGPCYQVWLAGQAAEIVVVLRLLLGIDVGDGGDSHFDGEFDGIGLKLMNRHVGAWNFGGESGLEGPQDFGGDLFFA